MRLEDAPNTALHANDPLIVKYMRNTFPNPYTLSSAEQWINMNLVLPYQHHFVLCERSSPDVAIGGIGLKPGMDVYAHTAEVGLKNGEIQDEHMFGMTKSDWDRRMSESTTT
jgi:hypothetical protein